MATKINIQIDQGIDLNKTIFKSRDVFGNIVDLSNLTGTCTLRKNYTANTGYNFSVILTAGGDVILSSNSSVTSSIIPGRYVYDVVAKDQSGEVSRIVEGYAHVTPSVSYFGNTAPAKSI